jgi:hypothetical protein
MYTYKSIYTYAYMLCTNRFVVIFVVIVWKITLNTRKKLKRDYLRRLFERIIWEESFEKNHLREIIWEKKGTEKKYLIRKDGTEYWESWDKTWTNKQVLLIEILSNLSSVSIFRPVLSYQIFLPRLLSLKWSFSNDSLE